MKQQLYDTILVVSGVLFINYAIHIAMGYSYPILKYTQINVKTFATQSIATNNLPMYYAENNGLYVPL